MKPVYRKLSPKQQKDHELMDSLPQHQFLKHINKTNIKKNDNNIFNVKFNNRKLHAKDIRYNQIENYDKRVCQDNITPLSADLLDLMTLSQCLDKGLKRKLKKQCECKKVKS